ncbi:MAG: RNA polymerase sigma factor [Planctomycetes bacterium]|nr:RNA polymerase sigma factor [Planctomycetota bacterium]
MPERPDLTQLLAESRWLAALARRLVADGEEAEDLAQDTLAAALAHPPQGDRPLRGWLATVLRGRWVDRQREQGARSAREHQNSRQEALPPTDDVVAKAEQQRLLVAAVLALTEPERTTVLLRFFEGLPRAPSQGACRPACRR